MDRISEKLFSKQKTFNFPSRKPLIKMPLIDVIESRRAVKREDIFLDLSSCRACGGTRVTTEPTKILKIVRRPICQYFGITER